MSDDEYDRGYDTGYDTGYEAGYESAREYIDAAYKDGEDSGYKDGHENGMITGKDEGYESGFADGKRETENEMIDKIDTLTYNYQSSISDFHTEIKWLKEELYKLRIENATITRTISKSTRDRSV